MCFQQQVPGIEDMRFHAGQRAHPAQDLGQIEVDVVPAPDHQGGGLPAFEVAGDRVEAGRVVAVIRDQRPLRLHVARSIHDLPVFLPVRGRNPPGHVGRNAGDVGIACACEGEMRGGLRLVLRVRLRPVRLRRSPSRSPPRAMRVGVLDDQPQDPLGRLHRDLQTDRRAPIVQVDEARPDLEPLQQLGHRLPDRRERDVRQHVGLAVPREVWSDDMSYWRQGGNDLAEHPR
jgi:hypothetical protein